MTSTPANPHGLRNRSISFGARTSRTHSSGSVLLILPAFSSVSDAGPDRASHRPVRALKNVPGSGANAPAGRKSLTAAAWQIASYPPSRTSACSSAVSSSNVR